MARPIKETPTLYGEDARRFAYAVEHPKADCGSRTHHVPPLARRLPLRDNMYSSKRMLRRCAWDYFNVFLIHNAICSANRGGTAFPTIL